MDQRKEAANGTHNLADEDLTRAVLASFEGARSERFKEVTQSLAKHLHAFVNEVKLTEEDEAAKQREKLRRAIELKDYEFNCHGVEFNHRYRSAAVVPDGTPEPAYDCDPELYYHPTTWPGARLPHCWLGRRGETASALDLVGKGRFTLLTGIGGEAWIDATREVSGQTGVEIVCFVVGPGREVEDLYNDWARLSGVDESGCLLVRPDAHVAYRRQDVAEDCAAELGRAMDAVLLGLAQPPNGRGVGAGEVVGAQ